MSLEYSINNGKTMAKIIEKCSYEMEKKIKELLTQFLNFSFAIYFFLTRPTILDNNIKCRYTTYTCIIHVQFYVYCINKQKYYFGGVRFNYSNLDENNLVS